MPPVIERQDLRHMAALTTTPRTRLEGLLGQQGLTGGGTEGKEGPEGKEGKEGKAGPWEAVAFSPQTEESGIGQTVRARTEGGKSACRLRGVVELATALTTGDLFFTLHAACHPTGTIYLYFRQREGVLDAEIEITPAGEAVYIGSATLLSGWYFLDDVTFNLT